MLAAKISVQFQRQYSKQTFCERIFGVCCGFTAFKIAFNVRMMCV